MICILPASLRSLPFPGFCLPMQRTGGPPKRAASAMRRAFQEGHILHPVVPWGANPLQWP